MISIILAIVFCGCCYGFYWIGYVRAMNRASEMLDSAFEEKFKEAGIVVKKDDRIIECNGMMIPMQCEKCCFGVVEEDEITCYAPDRDGVPVFGIKREERNG